MSSLADPNWQRMLRDDDQFDIEDFGMHDPLSLCGRMFDFGKLWKLRRAIENGDVEVPDSVYDGLVIYTEIDKYRIADPSKVKHKENHHIYPKELGGSDSSDNLIYVTPENHFKLHAALSAIFSDDYGVLVKATDTMSKGVMHEGSTRRIWNSETYERVLRDSDCPDSLVKAVGHARERAQDVTSEQYSHFSYEERLMLIWADEHYSGHQFDKWSTIRALFDPDGYFPIDKFSTHLLRFKRNSPARYEEFRGRFIPPPELQSGRSPFQRDPNTPVPDLCTTAPGRSTPLTLEIHTYLKEWLLSQGHFLYPYPTWQDLATFMENTQLRMRQLHTWFMRARKNIWQPIVRQQVAEGKLRCVSGLDLRKRYVYVEDIGNGLNGQATASVEDVGDGLIPRTSAIVVAEDKAILSSFAFNVLSQFGLKNMTEADQIRRTKCGNPRPLKIGTHGLFCLNCPPNQTRCFFWDLPRLLEHGRGFPKVLSQLSKHLTEECKNSTSILQLDLAESRLEHHQELLDLNPIGGL